MTPKPPTASAISRLLAAAGFKKSERQIGGFGTGYVVSKDFRREGAVRVTQRFWSLGSSRDDAIPYLAAYANAITPAGWNVEFGDWELIVTANPSPLLAAKDGDN